MNIVATKAQYQAVLASTGAVLCVYEVAMMGTSVVRCALATSAGWLAVSFSDAYAEGDFTDDNGQAKRVTTLAV